MQRELVQLLNCPAPGCGCPDLKLDVRSAEAVPYRTGVVVEVKEGAVGCLACKRTYPIESYVLSFEQLFPPELLEEARYWGAWYGFFWDKGYRGPFDPHSPAASLVARGIEIADPALLGGQDLPGTHKALIDHPLVREAERALDMACGCGWSSLYLSKRGHRVVGFDPSVENVRRAKRYAISQGEHIEYIAGALGYLDFKPASFDSVFALRSIGNVPDLRARVEGIRTWLGNDGVIAVDEHIHSDPMLGALLEQIEAWFHAEVSPRYETQPSGEPDALPVGSRLRHENAISREVPATLADNFAIESFSFRYVSLDLFSFMYYLWRECDRNAYEFSADIISHLYSFIERAYPERVEYVTLVGRKSANPGPTTEEMARTMSLVLSSQKAGAERASGSLTGVRSEPAAGIEALNAEIAALKNEAERLAGSNRHLQQSLDNASAGVQEMQETVSGLNETVHEKEVHIRKLQDALARAESQLDSKQAAIDDLEALVQRIESGRLMRIANKFPGKRR